MGILDEILSQLYGNIGTQDVSEYPSIGRVQRKNPAHSTTYYNPEDEQPPEKKKKKRVVDMLQEDPVETAYRDRINTVMGGRLR